MGVVHLSSTLEETRVQVEHITGVGLTTGRSSQKERHLSVGDGLLGEIVVDDQAVLAGVSEVLTNSAAGVGSQELEGGSLRGGGGNDDGILEGVVVTENLHDVGDGGSLLANGDVDAVELLGLLGVAVEERALLVDDGINGDSSLASLSVTNDELSLASANGDLRNKKGGYNLLIKDSARPIVYYYISRLRRTAAKDKEARQKSADNVLDNIYRTFQATTSQAKIMYLRVSRRT